MVFLNPNYKGPDTPPNYRDWLDLIYESIHHPDNPHFNDQNPGVKRAAELVTLENLSPEEWEESKIAAGRRMVIALTKEEQTEKMIYSFWKNGASMQLISKSTGYTEEDIKEVIEWMQKDEDEESNPPIQ